MCTHVGYVAVNRSKGNKKNGFVVCKIRFKQNKTFPEKKRISLISICFCDLINIHFFLAIQTYAVLSSLCNKLKNELN